VFRTFSLTMPQWLNEAEVSIQSTGPLARPLLLSITGRGFSHVKYLVNNNMLTENDIHDVRSVNVTFSGDDLWRVTGQQLVCCV